MFYSQEVLNHYENPQNVGSIDKNLRTSRVLVGAPDQGAIMRIDLVVKQGMIEDIKYKVYGGGAAIAALSWLSEQVKGQSVQKALSIKSDMIVSALHLEPVKMVYAIMAEDCLKKALA